MPDRLYVSYLDGIDAAPPVGTLFEPDLEALAGVNPDLVIVGGRTAAQYDAVSALAPTIDMTIWEDTIGEARSRIKTYGDLFDKQDKAAELTADFDAKLEAAKAAVASKGNALIVLTNGPKVSAYGKARASAGSIARLACQKPTRSSPPKPMAIPSPLSSSMR